MQTRGQRRTKNERVGEGEKYDTTTDLLGRIGTKAPRGSFRVLFSHSFSFQSLILVWRLTEGRTQGEEEARQRFFRLRVETSSLFNGCTQTSHREEEAEQRVFQCFSAHEVKGNVVLSPCLKGHVSQHDFVLKK